MVRVHLALLALIQVDTLSHFIKSARQSKARKMVLSLYTKREIPCSKGIMQYSIKPKAEGKQCCGMERI